jgi:hypothetical protein
MTARARRRVRETFAASRLLEFCSRKERIGQTGELLVVSSPQPVLDSSRVLIEKGFDPGTLLEMKHAGSDVVALRCRLGKAARLSVEEGVNGPRFVPFRNAPKPCVDAPPIPSGTSPACLSLAKVRA